LGHIDVVQSLLLGAKVSVDDVDGNGWTALHHAADNGHVAVAQLLLRAHMSVNAAATPSTAPLHVAAAAGHTAVVQLLLDAHADINAADKRGRSPVWYAESHGRTDTVQLLLAAPQLAPCVWEAIWPCMVGAARAAAVAGHSQLTTVLLKDLMAKDRPAAEAEAARHLPLVAAVLRQCEVAGGT
jgi:ankyrin repeat protein